jgi:transcriptional regulator with XRE-family HTH domain
MSAKIGVTKRHHVLCEIRQILGFSRTTLAKRAGISPGFLRKLEDGQRDMTPKCAWRLSLATDASPKELMLGAKGKAVGFSGAPLTKKTHDDNQRISRETGMNQVDRDVGIFADQIETMLDASLLYASRQNPTSYKVLFTAIGWMLNEIEEEFKLKPHIQSIKEAEGLWCPPSPLAPRYPLGTPVRASATTQGLKNQRRMEMYAQKDRNFSVTLP